MTSKSRRSDGGPAFPQPYPPQAFEKAMIFIDGTNLFNRLRGSGIKIPSLLPFIERAANHRQLLRASIYTTEDKLEAARQENGQNFAEGFRLIFGDSIASADGGTREKGVDALLVADLVYHAAQRNCQYMVLVSNDSDFRFALARVADFGCRTGLIAICAEATKRLQNEADDYWYLSREWLLENEIAYST